MRFFDKSLRLYHLPGVKALRDKAEKLMIGIESLYVPNIHFSLDVKHGSNAGGTEEKETGSL